MRHSRFQWLCPESLFFERIITSNSRRAVWGVNNVGVHQWRNKQSWLIKLSVCSNAWDAQDGCTISGQRLTSSGSTWRLCLPKRIVGFRIKELFNSLIFSASFARESLLCRLWLQSLIVSSGNKCWKLQAGKRILLRLTQRVCQGQTLVIITWSVSTVKNHKNMSS